MKTNFLPRSKKRGKRRELALAAFVLILAVGLFSLFGRRLTGVLAPLWRSNLYAASGLKNLVGSLRSKDELITENTELKDRLANDEELIVSLRAVASSRDGLLAGFGRVAEQGIPAGVLVHPPETPYDILLVDAGDDLGVKQGALVYTPAGDLVGTISQVLARTAQVKLYSSAGERTDAVLERGNTPVTLIGRGGGNMEFTLPRDADVEVGDRIIGPRLRAPLMAVVGRIDVTPTDSFKTVLVSAPENLETIRYVTIVND